jgi:hypothetical protein
MVVVVVVVVVVLSLCRDVRACSIFAGGGAYFVGGTLIKSRLPNASSSFYNNIPNRDFWFDVSSSTKAPVDLPHCTGECACA